jgi:hypothetical protein
MRDTNKKDLAKAIAIALVFILLAGIAGSMDLEMLNANPWK